jgi:hypothetical protein
MQNLRRFPLHAQGMPFRMSTIPSIQLEEISRRRPENCQDIVWKIEMRRTRNQ